METDPSNLLAKNKWLLLGGGVVIVVIIFLLSTRNNDFGDPALFDKVERLVTGTSLEAELFFIEGLPGWRSPQAIHADGSLLLEEQSVLLRDKSFVAGQGILLNFELSEINSDPSEPSVTFFLQNAPNPDRATHVISLLTLPQPVGIAYENGEPLPPDKFVRNMTLVPDETYTVVMGFDEDGRFVASVFSPLGVEEDATFTFNLPLAWAEETWHFYVQTGDAARLTLFSGREFAFNEVRN